MDRVRPLGRSGFPDYGEKHCIWMNAGIISFKLCPSEYDCEHCDFDIVMRRKGTSKPESGDRPGLGLSCK